MLPSTIRIFFLKSLNTFSKQRERTNGVSFPLVLRQPPLTIGTMAFSQSDLGIDMDIPGDLLAKAASE